MCTHFARNLSDCKVSSKLETQVNKSKLLMQAYSHRKLLYLVQLLQTIAENEPNVAILSTKTTIS